MNQFIPLIVGVIALSAGSVLGYYVRQSIAKRRIGTIEQKLQKRIKETQHKAELIINEAEQKANQVFNRTRTEEGERRKRLLKTEQLLLKREHVLDKRILNYEEGEEQFQQKVRKLKGIKENLESLRQEAIKNLEKASGLTKEEAQKELINNVERESQKEILEKSRKLELEGREKLERRAKEILATVIQKCALSQAQEITTTVLTLPSEEIKGRIIGKEGRNVRALERLTGTEIIIDETPETVVVSGFDPIRRQIAKISLERLIQDGRIQPAKIEEIVRKTEEDIVNQTKKAGEDAVYSTGVVGLHPKLVQLLGRLKFRTSYGQNVLLHSIEVSYLAEALAAELGLNSQIAKKAGLLHDIGKAVDHQIEGSHVDIGIKLLEKFDVENEIILAMKSHHDEYPTEGLEAVVVKVADQISGARPGARKDTLENYLKRLEELEAIATSFSGVDKAYAIQAGREIRVFVNPQEVNDLVSHKLAREIADRIQEELKYPGEIKVNVIRENRVVEYAK